MECRKVVVTGLGMITAIGKDKNSTWESLLAGRSGMGPVAAFDPEGYRTTFAAEVRDFDPTVAMDLKASRKADRYAQFGVVAAVEAMNQAQPGEVDPFRAGVIIGSGIGGMLTFEEQHRKLLERGPLRISPLFIPMMIADMAAGLVSIRYGYKGTNLCTTSACASGAHAIGMAYDQICHGNADVIIAGGAEASVFPMALSGFGAMKALSTRNDDPQAASRPFDKERDGFVLGEGAGILVMEEEQRAVARGAEILGEVTGYGFTADAYHMAQPDNEGTGMREAMCQAIRMSDLACEDIGYINAHGTSTHFNDLIETKAIRDCFGDHAEKLAISSTKSMHGHLLGATGGVEAVISVMALKHGILPPTINLDNPDPECDLDYCPNQAVTRSVEYALSNSFGFGGHNVSLCFKARP